MNETAATDPVLSKRPQSRVWRKLRGHRSAMFGAVLVGMFVLLALAAPILPVPDPAAVDWTAIRQPPSAAHWLGTDELGRDQLSRMIWGARASLMAGVVSVGIAIVIGVPLGIIAGYFGGWTDAVISRCTEALLAIPFLILAIALAAFLGPSLTNAMIAIGIAATPVFIRLTRGQAINVASEDYVESAHAIGLSTGVILRRYIFPNVLPPILVQATLTVASAIIAEASLSFLGLGQQPPAPSWGAMLNVAKGFMTQAPWMALWPGIAIFLVVLGFNLLGDGLRDALDPRED
ncbi:MAG: ABC transporter permease [Paracoccus sp. (in: a-proteobacteria)]|jgi:peptide/nickel transport system permease protein|uniref:ABC transporter permease n=1 Tax=unclassified Paracoccus (in: a-proteobacteria) TaxID=2688777 RepID=UPI000C4AF818|nr:MULTISPECIES: ABC transporter permease [unclassified Paracoccus (in: a-proteobacteria)]MAN57851.1 diguanylate cyclase [Paracoccus sp. (in: a-proteobacteria)]MBA48130.1 diguanylate cyclase [Paracoccus sp. (in: a-proteobacteria)]MDB2551180.1 ABC transporter permease [Paracoccus sp. (in: a-proteobacteria)]HIC64723.1 ABC transporter permease [Paracoccus sp. (in: a-proteobacteria)]|tara:strand:+ start:3210 stop:4082 length:873 start_codon:yes stop_codon:yes gene_type:complete